MECDLVQYGPSSKSPIFFLFFSPLPFFSFCLIYFILCRGSEDTALLFLKEIYRTMNINPEQPQH